MTEPNFTAALRGDFSRIRFDPSKSYTRVLEQQGRVALDADANEQRLIDAYQSKTQLVDVVGNYGGPADDANYPNPFKISVSADGSAIQIGAGRYYVYGLLCENAADELSYDQQHAYLKIPPAEGAGALLSQLQQPENAGKVLQVSLQVWQRLQTALDDPALLEPAIGTADTTARLQTAWRVLAQLGDPNSSSQTESPPSTGTMIAGTAAAATDCGCGPIAAAGYQGIENQLYRVEIHTGTDPTKPNSETFKWSRENGSVVVAVTAVTAPTVTVSSLGPDANLGFQVGQWVELTDDTYEFGPTPNAPGTLYQIASIQPADPSVTLTLPPGAQIAVDRSQNARMRRWDQSGPSATNTGIPLSEDSVQLENGIQIQFGAGTYQSGDYWTIPARAATGQIDWPAGSIPPTTIQVYSAPLATVSFVKEQSPPFQCHDARTLFKPLTQVAPPPTPQAIHVVGISWVNDAVMTVDQLVANGISITLDNAAIGPITAANFVVTLETVVPLFGVDPFVIVPPDVTFETTLQFPTMVLRAPIFTSITASSTKFTWHLDEASSAQQAVDTLNKLCSQLSRFPDFHMMRVRLLGAAIYALETDAPPRYLDGQARRDPNPKSTTGLLLPSGSGAVASDFEGWFFLAPTLEIQRLTLTPAAVGNQKLTLVVNHQNQITGLAVNGTVGKPQIIVTATLTEPAITTATILWALFPAGSTPSTAVGTFAIIPATTQIPAGSTFSNATITFGNNPGPNNTFTFTVTATLSPLVGRTSSSAAPFSITGGAPPLGPG